MARRKQSFAQIFRPLSSAGSRTRIADGPDANPAFEAIWQVVGEIPPGRVTTYGAVARAAGLPGRARQTGRALREAPEALNLPWHRVVGAGGRIVFPKSSREYKEQSRRLRAEGIVARDGRVPPAAMIALDER